MTFNRQPMRSNHSPPQIRSRLEPSPKAGNAKETERNMDIRLKVALAGLVLATVAGAGTGQVNEKARDYTGYMQGSWSGSVTIRNCLTGDVLAGPLPGLTTFHQGGTLSETRVSAPTSPRGPGHGTWYRTGRHEFAVKIVFQRFDLNGFLVGTQEILATNDVAQDSKHLSVNATFKVLDNSGATLASGCASGDSERIE
jgi:hypothetical protein